MNIIVRVLCVAVALGATQWGLAETLGDDGGDVEVGSGSSPSESVEEGVYVPSVGSEAPQHMSFAASLLRTPFPGQAFRISPIAVGIPTKVAYNDDEPPLVLYNSRNQLGGNKHADDDIDFSSSEEEEDHNSPHNRRRRELHQNVQDRQEELEEMVARVTNRRRVTLEELLVPHAVLLERDPNNLANEEGDHDHGHAMGGGGMPSGRHNHPSASGMVVAPPAQRATDNADNTPFKTVVTYVPFSSNSPVLDIVVDHMRSVLAFGSLPRGPLGMAHHMADERADLVGYRGTSESDHRPVVTFMKAYIGEAEEVPLEVLEATGLTVVQLRDLFNRTWVPFPHAKSLAVIHHPHEARKFLGATAEARSVDVIVEPPVAAKELPILDSDQHDHHRHSLHHRQHFMSSRMHGGFGQHSSFAGAIVLSDYHIEGAAVQLRHLLQSSIAASQISPAGKEVLSAYVGARTYFRIVARLPTSEESQQYEADVVAREEEELRSSNPSEHSRIKQRHKHHQSVRSQPHRLRMGAAAMALRHFPHGGDAIDPTYGGHKEVTILAFAIEPVQG